MAMEKQVSSALSMWFIEQVFLRTLPIRSIALSAGDRLVTPNIASTSIGSLRGRRSQPVEQSCLLTGTAIPSYSRACNEGALSLSSTNEFGTYPVKRVSQSAVGFHEKTANPGSPLAVLALKKQSKVVARTVRIREV